MARTLVVAGSQKSLAHQIKRQGKQLPVETLDTNATEKFEIAYTNRTVFHVLISEQIRKYMWVLWHLTVIILCFA